MGDAQSAQREGMKDEAGEEESGKVDDAQAETSPEDKGIARAACQDIHEPRDKNPFKNIGQISEINEKAGSSIAEVNNHCEDEIATDAVLTPDEEVSETENPLEEETPSKPIEKNEIESSNEADVAEDVSLDMTEMDAKTNDINEGFRRFFSNIGLRLSIKRGSTDLLRDLPDETNDANANDANDEPSGQENFEDSAEEIQMEDAEQNTDVNIAQVSTDNDSTACPTITDVTPEDVLENAEEKATEAKEDVESDNADESITLPAVEESHQNTTPEEESNLVPPPEHEEVVSPIKRFFTTGIFSGLRKKKKAVEDDVNEKEMVDMGKKETVEFVEETEYNQQEEKEKIDPGVEAAVVDTEHTENETKQEILTVTSAKKVDEGKSPTTDHSTAIDTTTTTVFPESETLNSQEKDKVQASPLKRLLSGSSFKKLSKKPRSRRSSDSKLSDSGEHAADQFLSSTESTENQEEEKSTQPSLEAAGQEDGAWVSFKKLLTPKKHTRTTSLSIKETEFPDSVEEPKPTDGEQISDHSTEEGKKRKDSSVSWEAVLCRSGKKRSRKTSDSEDESPQIDDNKQEVGSKNGSELPEERANEKKNDVSVSSPKQSPSIGDGGSTWKSFKRLVTPKKKVKDEDEGKDNIQSDSEVSQDESSFSIKKLLPGRKKRKSTEKQDHASSDEIDKDVPSDDEDSETPAVVPMSEFDAPQSLVQIQTQVDIVSHFPKEVSQDLLHQMAQPVLPCESLQNEGKKLEENVDAVDNGTSIMTAKIEQLDVSEIISKHQQLSDITEEGIITETMATPVSINEEVGRDDTLAEDLLEITSEAITAPEPASVTTLADETEMISAVSQLSSESSKTSGNTTPVPAEYEVKETEKLLHQVVENISTSPMAVTISSAPPKSESIVGSVLHHIFRTFVKEDKETTILEIHRKSDATAINTGPTAQEVDAVNELAAKAQIESVSAEAEHILEAEVITTVQEAQLDSRTTNLSLDIQEPEVLLSDVNDSVKDIKTEEGASTGMQVVTECTEEGSQTIPPTEGNLEPEDPSKTLYVQEAEESQTAQQSLLGQLMRSLLPQKKVLSDDLSQKETVTDEPQPETELKVEPEGKLQDKGAKIDDNQEPEVLLSDVEDSVKDLKTEEGSSTGMQVVTECTEESSETIPHTEGSLESEDPSKTDHVEEPEESQTAQESLFGQLMRRLLPQKKVLSDDLPQKETVTDEPQPETEGKDESEDNLPVNAKHIPEAEVITTVQEAQLDSMTTNLSLEKVIVEDITELETVREKPQNVPEWRIEPEEKLQVKGAQIDDTEEPEVFPSDVKDSVKDIKIEEVSSTGMQVVTECTEDGSEIIPHTEGSLELEDTSRTDYVEESEELQTAQQSLLGQLMCSLLPQKKVLSDDLSLKEIVPDEPQKEREVRDESEENLPVEAEHIPEAEVKITVQEVQVDPMTTNLSLEKVIVEDITALETVRDEPQQETEVRLKPEGKLQAKGAETDENQEPEVLISSVEDSFKDLKTEEGASTDMQVVIECTEEGNETIPHTEGSLEPEDPSKTDHVEEPEESQTAQESLLGQLMRSLLPQKQVLSEDLSQKETVTDEPQPETEVKDESEENLPVEAEHIPEAEVKITVQEVQVDSMTTNLSLEKVIVEDITALETVRDEPQQETEVRLKPEGKLQAKGAETDENQEPEVLISSVEDSFKDLKTEEGASTDMQVVPECTEEGRQTIPHTEGSLEPEDPLKTDHVEEPEESQTSQRSLFSQLMRSLLPQTKVLSEDLSQKETVPEEPQQETEVKDESEENLPVEAEHIPEAEVKITVQEVQVDPMTTNLSLEKVIVEDITALETVRDEPQQETEVRLKPEGKLQAKGAETDENQEPEVLISSVEDSFKDLKTEEGASTDMQVVIECTEEGSETIPHTEGSLEPEDPSKTDHVEEPEESQTAQESLLGQLMRSLLPQKQVLSEDLSQKETVTDEPQPETEVKDESEENLPVEAEHIPEAEVKITVQEVQVDSMTTNLSLEKVIVEDITALETVRDEPQQETEVRLKPEGKLQAKGAETDENQEPEVLISSVEDSFKDLKTEEGASTDMQVVTECTEEGSETIPHTEGSLEPEDPSKTDYIEEPQESQTALESLLGQPMRSLLPQKQVLSDDLSQKETVTDEPQPETEVMDESEENLPVEAEHISEAEVITAVQEAQLDSKTTNLSFEKVLLEDITPLQTVRDEPQQETEVRLKKEGKLQAKGAKIDDNQEPEVLLSDVEDSVKDFKTEEGSSTGMQVVTECTEESSETIPHTKGSLESEDPSKTDHVEEPEESQTAQESLFGQLMRSLLPQKKVLSDDLPQKETVTDEPQPETEGKDESEDNLPVNAKHIPEAEVITTVQEAQLDSMTTNLSLEKVIVEDITELETVREKPQNVPEWRIEPEEKLQVKGAQIDDIEEPEVFPSDVKDSVKDIKTEEVSSTGMQVVTECTEDGSEIIPHTEGSLEPEDPSKTLYVQEPEELQTAEQSLLSQLMRSLLPQTKVLSEDLSQKETIPGVPQPETEVRDESAENLPVEAEHIPEAEIITTVQEGQLDSMTTNLSLEKVVVEDVTALETVKDKPQNETELRVEPEGKLQSKGAKTDDNQEPEVLPSDVEDSVKDLKTEKGASTDMQVVTECTEEGSKTIPHIEGSLEPEDTSKTDHIEEPQESQTAQESLLGQVMHSLLPQKKVLSDDLSQKETVTDEPQPETEVKDESEENLPVEAKHIPEVEVLPIVQEAQLDSMTTNLPLEKLIVEDITELETVKDEPQNVPDLRIEPEEKLQAKGVNTHYVQELSDVEDSVKDIKTEEGAYTDMQVVTECTEEGSETIPHIEGSLEPEDTSKTDHIEEPQESQTAQESLLGQVMHSLLPQKKVLSDDLSQKETVTDEPQPETEGKDESEDNLPVNAKHIPEAEVITTVQEAQLDSMTTNLSLEKVIVEDITELETVREKPQNVPEWRIEPEEKLQVKGAQIDDIEEPEVFPSDVKDSVKDIKTEEVSSTGMQVVTECTEDGSEIIPHTEGSLEPEDPSKTLYVQEPEELQTAEQSLLSQLMRSLLPQTKVLSEDLSQKETIPGVPQPETEVRDESAENLPVEAEHIPEAEIITTVQEGQLDSMTTNLSLEKVVVEDVTALETVKDKPQNETELRVEPEGKLQSKGAKTDDNQEPEVLPSDVEDSVKDLKTEKGASTDMQVVTECTEEGSKTIPHIEGSLEPEDTSKTDHIEEPQESQTAQESLLGQVMHSLLPQKKVLSDDLSQKETVTDEPQPETEVKDESEENLPVEAKHIPEVEVLPIVQEAQLDSMTTNLPLEKLIVEDITELETVKDEPQNVPDLRIEPEEKLQAKGVNTHYVQELSDVEDSVKDIKTEEGAYTDMQVVTECTEEGSETIPHTEGSLEPEDPSKTEDVDQLEESKIVQASLLGQVMHILLPQKKTSSDDILQRETVADEPQPGTEEEATVANSQSDEKVMLKDITLMETVCDEPQKALMVEPKAKLQVNIPKTDDVQESEDVPCEREDSVMDTKTERDAPNHMQVVEECTEEASANTLNKITQKENNLEPVDPLKTDFAEEPEVQESLLGLLMNSPLPNKVLSDVLSPKETVTNEPQSRTEERDDPEKNVPVEAVTTEYVQEPEVLPSGIEETVKENRTKEGALTDLLVITESTEMGKATLPLSEGALEPVDHSKTEWVQEPEQLQAEQPSRLDSKAGSPLIEHILSDDITAVAPFTEVHTLKADVTMELEEEQPVETSETEFVQEQEVLPPDAKDNAKETKPEEHTSMYIYVVTETTVPTPDADNTIVSVTDTIEREVVAQFDKAAEKSYGHKTERIVNNAHVFEQEDSIPEVTEELQAIPQVHVSSVDNESKLVQVQEKTIVPEEIQDPAVDNAKMQDEFKHEVHLSAVQVSVEREKESELSSTAINNAALQHAKGTQVATCDMKKVSAPIPDLLPDKTLYITEPLIDRVASQEVFGGATTTKPSVKDDTMTAEQYTVIQSVHVPSEFEGNHEIQMQVVDADLKSAGTIVDNVLEIGVTETKEVTDYCQDTMKTVENFFATPEIEKEFTHEEIKINVQVIPCVPEKVSESAVTILEQAIIKQPDALTAVSDLAASESNQIGNQKVIKGGTGTLTEKEEKSFVSIDDSAIAQQVSVDLTNPQDLPFGLNVSIGSHKEKLQQTKAKQATSEAGVIVREVKALPEDSDVEEESVQTVKPIIPTQSTGSEKQINSTEASVPAKEITGPDSLLVLTEKAVITTQPVPLDVAIETVQLVTKSQTSQSPTKIMDCTEPVKQMDVLEDGSQEIEALEPVMPIIVTQSYDSPTKTKATKVNGQPTENTKPTANFVLIERALIMTHPQILEVGMHFLKTVERVTKTSDFPPSTTDRTKTEGETDVSVVECQALKETGPAKTVISPEREIKEQTEPSEVNNQSTEIREPATISESTERAVITTHPELLGEVLQFDAEDTVKDTTNEGAASIDTNQRLKESMKESATILQNKDNLESEDPSKTENVQEPEVKESLLGLLVRNLLPQKKESSEDFSEKETDTDECQPKNEVRDEPDELLGVGIHPTEVVELVEKTTGYATDQERIEPTEVNIQPIEISEPVANLAERALITTQPELSDVSMHLIKTVEQVARASDSPPSTADRTETQKERDASVVGFQELKETEPAKTVISPERKIQEQIEPSEVNKQSTEITEAAKISESTERAVITTHPELLGEVLQFDAEDTVKDTKNEEAVSIDTDQRLKESTKENATIPNTEDSLEPEDPSKTENVQEPEVKESLLVLLMRNLLPQKKESSEDFSKKEAVTDECQPKTEVREEPDKPPDVGIHPTEVVELVEETTGYATTDQELIEQTEVNIQPIEITEPVTNLVERALIMTQPELSDVSMHLIKTVEQVARASDSPPSTADRTETQKERDASVVGFQELKETEPAKTVISPERKIQEQIEPSEVNKQSTEITEAAKISESTERAVITTHPELLGEVLQFDAEDTVKDTKNEEAVSIDTDQRLKESTKENATIPNTEDSLEPEDPSKTENVQEPEVKESLLVLLMRNLLPQKKESSEDFSEKEAVTDECQPKTEVRDEPDKPPDVGIHPTEVVELVEKTTGYATTDQELIEQTEVNIQPIEITEPVANLVERALIMTQPELSDVSMHLIKTVEQVARASDSPPSTADRTETQKETDASVVGFQELKEIEPAKTVILPERKIQEQIEPSEVNNQSTEITEAAKISESTERAVVTTHPELLGEVLQFDAEDTVKDTTNEEAVSIDTNVVKECTKERTTIHLTEGSLEPEDPSKTENVQEPEVKESLLVLLMHNLLPQKKESSEDFSKKEAVTDECQPKTEVRDEPEELLEVGIHPTEVVELGEATTDQEQIKPTEVNYQPIEISEPVANLVERALITTQPELSDVSMHLIKTVEQVTQASDSPPSTADRTETQKETDASAVGFQELKEIEPAKTVISPERKIQEQIEPSEVNKQSTEITEAAKISESTERAVITTHPELLGEVLQFDAEDTVKDTKNEEAVSIDTDQRLKESTKENATIPNTEDSLEPEDPSKTENVQEPEVKESLLVLLMRNLLPQKKESSEDFSEKEAVTDECQPKTEVREEPDKPPDVGIHPTEVVELVEETTGYATTDQELIEQTEVNIQPIEITEPVTNLVERALIMTQPELSDVSMHLIKTVEQVARASDSPPSTADRTETQKERDASVVGFQELKEIEPAKTVILPERKIQEQIEPSEVNNQSTEITEAAKISESTERAVVTTHPELLGEVLQFDAEDTVKDTTNEEAVSIDTNVVKECTKERTKIHLTEGSLESEDPSKTENVQEPEVKESLLVLLMRNLLPQKKESSEDFSEKEAVTDECQPKTEVRDEPEELLGVGIHPTEVVELVEATTDQEQIKPTEVNYQPIEISEPVTNLVERALITTQPELSDVSMHLIETKSLLETNVSKVVIHVEEAVESEMPINSTQRAESQEDPELTETDAQATEVTEPTVNIVIPAVVTTNPALLDNGIHPAATVELVSNVQANELMQSASQTEERKVFRGEPVHSEDCDKETKANVNNTEEENDQDVWMDAEEVIYNQEGTEVSPLEVEEPEEEPEPEGVHEEPARLEESELAFNTSTEEEESQHKGYKRGETCEIESEGEDFAIALEHQEYATVSITTLEWD